MKSKRFYTLTFKLCRTFATLSTQKKKKEKNLFQVQYRNKTGKGLYPLPPSKPFENGKIYFRGSF